MQLINFISCFGQYVIELVHRTARQPRAYKNADLTALVERGIEKVRLQLLFEKFLNGSIRQPAELARDQQLVAIAWQQVDDAELVECRHQADRLVFRNGISGNYLFKTAFVQQG